MQQVTQSHGHLVNKKNDYANQKKKRIIYFIYKEKQKFKRIKLKLRQKVENESLG